MQRKQLQFLDRISAVIELGKFWEIRVHKFKFGENEFRALGTFLLVCVSSLGSKELQKPINWYQSVIDHGQWCEGNAGCS